VAAIGIPLGHPDFYSDRITGDIFLCLQQRYDNGKRLSRTCHAEVAAAIAAGAGKCLGVTGTGNFQLHITIERVFATMDWAPNAMATA
jgi:hypothetical protein